MDDCPSRSQIRGFRTAVPGAWFDVVEQQSSRHRLAVAGEIDIATAPALRTFLHTHLGEVPPGSDVLVDLSRVYLLAAAGLRVLLEAAAAARRREVGLRLYPLSPAVASVLDLTGTRPDFDQGAR